MNPYEQMARMYAERYGLDPDIFARQIAQESGFDPKAGSPAGAMGLGQLMPDTAKELGVTDPWDPSQNLDGSARYMSQQLKQFGNYQTALAAYNAGPGAVSKYGGVPPYAETQDYVQKIMGGSMNPTMPDQSMGGGPSSLDPTMPDQSMGGGPSSLDPASLARLGILPTNSQAQQPSLDPNSALNSPFLMALMGQFVDGRGALAGLQVYQQQQRLNQEIDRTSQMQGVRGLPTNIQEMVMLKKMYPSLSDEQIMSMAFSGRIAGTGTEFQKVGDQVYRVSKDSFGNPSMAALTPNEQKQYEDVIKAQNMAGSSGSKFGEEQVKVISDTSTAYADAVSSEQHTKEMLRRFESGEFDKATGPLSGFLGQYFNPETAALRVQETDQMLQNLKITNLAPVSDHEGELVRSMWASSTATPEMNKKILRDLAKIQEAKVSAIRKALDRLKTEPIQEYLLNPETIKLPDMTPPKDEKPAGYIPPRTKMDTPEAVRRNVDDWLSR